MEIDPILIGFLSVILVGVIYLVFTLVFPSKKKNKYSTEARKAVTDDPKFAKQKNIVIESCNDENVTEFLKFLKKYGGGKSVTKNGSSSKEFYPREKNDLKKIYEENIEPSTLVLVRTKLYFKEFLADNDIVVEQEGKGSEKSEETKAQSVSNVQDVKSEPTNVVKEEKSFVVEAKNAEKPHLENKQTETSKEKAEASDSELTPFEVSEEEKQAFKIKNNAPVQVKKPTISLSDLKEAPIETNKTTSLSDFIKSDAPVKPRKMSLSELMNSDIEEKPTKVVEPQSSSSYSKANVSAPINIEERLARMNFVIDKTAQEEAPAPVEDITDEYELEKLKNMKQRGEQALSELLETLPASEFKVFKNLKITADDEVAIFDYVIVGPSKVSFIHDEPFGLSAIEGGDDEANLDITENAEWILKKNHTRKVLTDPTTEIVQNKKVVDMFMEQFANIKTSFALVLTNGMLTYHSDAQLSCDLISINSLKEHINKSEEEELMNEDDKVKLLSKFDAFVKASEKKEK